MDFIDLPNVTTLNMIETCSGLYVDVANPDPATIRLNDMAWALSRQARFAGHTLSPEIWSVGQHSLFVEYLIDLAMSPDGFQLHWSLKEWLMAKGLMGDYMNHHFSEAAVRMGALIHDGPEAYLVDLPTPVKRCEGVNSGYKGLEAKMEAAMYTSFGFRMLTKLEHELVKWADMLALRIEAANLLPSRGRGWGVDMPHMNHADMHLFPKVERWSVVAEQFIDRFDQLRDDALRDAQIHSIAKASIKTVTTTP